MILLHANGTKGGRRGDTYAHYSTVIDFNNKYVFLANEDPTIPVQSYSVQDFMKIMKKYRPNRYRFNDDDIFPMAWFFGKKLA